MSKPSDLIHGTLDLLILNTISLQPQHGWAIAKRIQQVSLEVVQVSQGALYPALHRLEQQGWIRSDWRVTEGGRDAKFYTSPMPAARSWQKNWSNGSGCRTRSDW